MGAYEVMPDFYQYMKNPNADTNDWDWTIDPTGMEYLLRDIYQRYGIPMGSLQKMVWAPETFWKIKS